MCPELNNRSQSGFALPAAIFVLVVVAAIVAAMMRLDANQAISVNLDLLSSRAYWAATSGLEWGTHEVTSAQACFSNNTLTIGAFSVQVQCVADPYQEAGSDSVVRYQITSVAASQGLNVDDADYVYRSAQVELLIKK